MSSMVDCEQQWIIPFAVRALQDFGGSSSSSSSTKSKPDQHSVPSSLSFKKGDIIDVLGGYIYTY